VRVVLGVGLLVAVFCCGVAVGLRHWLPPCVFSHATGPAAVEAQPVPNDTSTAKVAPAVQATVDASPSDASQEYRGQEELLQFAFTDPLIVGQQIHPPVTSLDGIYEANFALELPVESFFDAFDALAITAGSTILLDDGATEVLRVTFRLAGREYDAYAYLAQIPSRLSNQFQISNFRSQEMPRSCFPCF
jgi:hypothetical protein